MYNWGLTLRTEAYRTRGEHDFYKDTSAALTTSPIPNPLSGQLSFESDGRWYPL